VERQIEAVVLHCWLVYTVAVGSMTDGGRGWFYDEATILDARARRAATMTATMSTGQSASETSAWVSGSDCDVNELSHELTRALDLALWTFDFRGDLEEALDGAWLRSVLAGTPTLSGGLLSTAAM
jgi:hypothetical protein